MQTDPSQRKAFLRFADAVHAFSDDPSHANFMRYRAASRALGDSQRRLGQGRGRRSGASQ